MNYQVSNKTVKNATFLAEIEISQKEIKKIKEKTIEKLIKTVEVPGFRKGKAPKDIAIKKLKESKILEETAKEVFTFVVKDLIQKENLEIYGEPAIEPIEISFEKPWKFKVKIPLKPKITLPDYRKIAQKIKSEQKTEEIWTPGKTKEEEKQKKMQKDVILNKILNEILNKTKIEISEIIIDQEVKRRLAGLIEDVRKAGLTLEDYLKARNTTVEELRERYKKEVLDSFKLELILETIADKENIQIEIQEVEKLLKKEKMNTEQYRYLQYYWAGVLRKQKTLEFLLSL